MRVLKVLLATVIVLSMATFSFAAGLLNTTDQVLNQNAALGGNSAIKALDKKSAQEVEIGLSLYDKFTQNKNILDEVAGYNGGDLNPRNQMPNQNLAYTYRIDNANWLGVSYGDNSVLARSYKQKRQAPLDAQKYESDTVSSVKTIAIKYGMDMNKMVKGLYLGATIAQNNASRKVYRKDNSQSKTALALSKAEATQGPDSAPYTSVAVDGIYMLDAKSKVTFGHLITNPIYMSQIDKNQNNAKTDAQWNEEVGDVTSLGYIYNLDAKIQLAGTVESTWDKSYTQYVSNGPQTEEELTNIGSNKYTLAGEYAYAKDMVFQGYYAWELNEGRVVGDGATDTKGTDMTEVGVNVVKSFGDQTLIAGLTNLNMRGVENGQSSDEMKFYVDYGIVF